MIDRMQRRGIDPASLIAPESTLVHPQCLFTPCLCSQMDRTLALCCWVALQVSPLVSLIDRLMSDTDDVFD